VAPAGSKLEVQFPDLYLAGMTRAAMPFASAPGTGGEIRCQNHLGGVEFACGDSGCTSYGNEEVAQGARVLEAEVESERLIRSIILGSICERPDETKNKSEQIRGFSPFTAILSARNRQKNNC
jgi:hypothetical protein